MEVVWKTDRMWISEQRSDCLHPLQRRKWFSDKHLRCGKGAAMPAFDSVV